ncbi:MAG: hypothetical protein LBR73_06285 [Oscillospiraceae bacterium]|jgi:hypothetical protein|nr:hypothetical protein [Oscillospiraceae bacterium]
MTFATIGLIAVLLLAAGAIVAAFYSERIAAWEQRKAAEIAERLHERIAELEAEKTAVVTVYPVSAVSMSPAVPLTPLAGSRAA